MVGTILGIVCVLGAIAIIFFRIDTLQLGRWSSRLVTILCALAGYYYVGGDAVIPIINWIMPILFILIALSFLALVIKNWGEEIEDIAKKSGWIAVVILLFILAKVLFIL